MLTSRALRLSCLLAGLAAWVVLSSGCSSAASAQQSTSPAKAPAAANLSYSSATVSTGHLTRDLRIGGTTQAVRDMTIRIPRIRGGGYSLVLVDIVQSGSHVKKGDVLATFDDTVEVQKELAAKATYDGFVHQVANQKAVNEASAEQRAAALKQAQTTLGTAQLEVSKGPILSAIQAGIDKLDVQDAGADVASITQQNALTTRADAAQLQVLELQRDQAKVDLDRALSNVDAMTIRAPLSGMVGLVPVFTSDGIAPAQPGDQLHSGQSLVRIFDPGNMDVNVEMNEADDAHLSPGLKGTLYLDAYPEVVLPVHFISASPVAVAAGGFGNPVRTFSAIFHVDAPNPKLLPDLSAAIDLKITSPYPELLVPRRSVRFLNNQAFVTKMAADGQWVQQRVELGNFDNQQVEVINGLKAGDQVQVPTEFAGEGE
ncbi:MAG: efflux RND transporter periplasmic adaptor subunit [Terriglobales bacterium]